MPYIANPNIMFKLSGVLLGEYIFEQNPASYSTLQPLQQQTEFKTIEGNDVYQRTFVDNELREMTWDYGTNELYYRLSNFAIRDTDGNIPISWFSDQTTKMFDAIPCKVIDVIGEPIAGNPSYKKITMRIKPEAYFDKLYKIL